jgi:hypothetical protein
MTTAEAEHDFKSAGEHSSTEVPHHLHSLHHPDLGCFGSTCIRKI